MCTNLRPGGFDVIDCRSGVCRWGGSKREDCGPDGFWRGRGWWIGVRRHRGGITRRARQEAKPPAACISRYFGRLVVRKDGWRAMVHPVKVLQLWRAEQRRLIHLGGGIWRSFRRMTALTTGILILIAFGFKFGWEFFWFLEKNVFVPKLWLLSVNIWSEI